MNAPLAMSARRAAPPITPPTIASTGGDDFCALFFGSVVSEVAAKGGPSAVEEEDAAVVDISAEVSVSDEPSEDTLESDNGLSSMLEVSARVLRSIVEVSYCLPSTNTFSFS